MIFDFGPSVTACSEDVKQSIHKPKNMPSEIPLYNITLSVDATEVTVVCSYHPDVLPVANKVGNSPLTVSLKVPT